MEFVYLRETHKKKARKINLGERLAGGAAGDIFRLKRQRKKLGKIYKRDEDRTLYGPKVWAMLESSPARTNQTIGDRKFQSLAWPLGVLESSTGDFLGFSMPEVDFKASVSLERMMQKRMRVVSGLPEFYGSRITAAYNLAACLETLHKLKHFVIDLKPVNCRIYPENMLISLLDCDGFSVNSQSGKRFPASQFTPEYIAPEAAGKAPEQLGEQQDLFALAVIIFKLLNNGLHPFQCRILDSKKPTGTLQEMVNSGCYAYGIPGSRSYQPARQSVHESFSSDLRRLFDRAFKLQRGHRPSASEWRRGLRQYINPKEGKIFVCDKNPTEHAHFGQGCGWCALEQTKGKKIPFPTSKNTSSNKPIPGRKGLPQSSLSSGSSSIRPSKKRVNLKLVLWGIFAIGIVGYFMGEETEIDESSKVNGSPPDSSVISSEFKYINKIGFTRAKINVRTAPKSSSKIIGKLKKGAEVLVLSDIKGKSGSQENGWYKVRYRVSRRNAVGEAEQVNIEGFASSKYILLSNLGPGG